MECTNTALADQQAQRSVIGKCVVFPPGVTQEGVWRVKAGNWIANISEGPVAFRLREGRRVSRLIVPGRRRVVFGPWHKDFAATLERDAELKVTYDGAILYQNQEVVLLTTAVHEVPKGDEHGDIGCINMNGGASGEGRLQEAADEAKRRGLAVLFLISVGPPPDLPSDCIGDYDIYWGPSTPDATPKDGVVVLIQKGLKWSPPVEFPHVNVAWVRMPDVTAIAVYGNDYGRKDYVRCLAAADSPTNRPTIQG
jgi:hypothetical protein